MRSIIGFIIVLLLVPAFTTLVMATSDETKKVKGIHEVLDGKIDVSKTALAQTSYILDGDSQVISEINEPVNRTYLSIENIPEFIQQVFIIAEDRHFYEHKGFDLAAMGRAFAINAQSDNIKQGASTITQQLARNLYLNYDRTYNRKITELLYSYELERTYSKQQILELYLNAIYFANGAYGVEAAAQLYFQKSVQQLSKAELTFIAAIPNNPSMFDPLVHFEDTKKRQELLLNQLRDMNYISSEECEKLKQEAININLKQEQEPYPDYTTFVEAELKELIGQQEGFTDKINAATGAEKEKLVKSLDKRYKEVLASGIKIHTALNPSVQNKAKAAVQNYLPYADIEGAAVVIDPEKHEINALVGGKTYQKYDFNRAFQAYRQPGSSIKPLLVYAPYIQRTKASITSMVNANDYCYNGYCPKNFDRRGHGMVTLETAFKYSYNTPAVRLLEQVGVENAFEDLKAFHFKKVVEEDQRLPAAVGGFTYGMSPLELTSAFTVFANDGVYQPSHAIRKVTNSRGNVLYEWKEVPVKVWDSDTISKLRVLMQQTVRSGTATVARINAPYAGGKTGTTDDFKDHWFVGLTDSHVAGVWVGKDNPANTQYLMGAAPQLLIWRDIMRGY